MEEMEIKPGELSITTHLPEQWKQEHDAAIAAAKAITSCSDDYAARSLGASLKRIKDCKKIVHDERMKITRKIDAFKKNIMFREDSICSELTAEETRLAKLGTDYATAKAAAEEAARKAEEEARRIAAEQAAAEAMLTGEDPSPDAMPVQEQEEPKKPLVTGVRTHTVVSFTIVDAYAVPRAYCSPDEKAIRAYIQAVKDNNPNWDVTSFQIPGVEFTKEVRV